MKKLAYVTSKILFYTIAIVLLFLFVFSIFAFLEYKFELDILFVDVIDNRGKVHVPVLGLNINVPFNYAIFIMWIVMAYYIIYFYAFKEFLKVFVKKELFDKRSLKRLRLFLILNMLPLGYIIIFTSSFLIKGVSIRFGDDYFIVFAHLVIAFLIYLYLDVLKKGRYIKEENDLTI
ncbi:DUF2975 domain-containing protein [Hyunsoonleella sp. 2307UL5-6]|uniref:DUF2975 domain-containing protein n=1 Tax=Hyunsoonleella sp. 2307UL5-6 TaxID=3384768 RepID=UPI0039BCDF60